MTLKPCPFCGSTKLKTDSICWQEVWMVECMEGECGTEGPLRRSEADAQAAWNIRKKTANSSQMQLALT